ncbi:uncharacterized protein LOC142327607 [Lycorma delicatula]|uniref:uncharacterized protein LOC142327607 n=1 Tax=Lycorma delicatula TaxID=130591 RepID=UPI003F517E41
MACCRSTLALAASLLFTISCILRGTMASIPPEENNYKNQIETWEDYSGQEIPHIQVKRASNLGSRFNLGKKFVGYTSWLGSDALRQRRTHYYTNTNSNQQALLRRAEPYWWLRNY